LLLHWPCLVPARSDPYQGAAGSCTGLAWYQQEATLHYEDHD